jgi:branched-chain amino acid transport system permease protein
MSELLPQLIQQLFNGLSLGAIYALIAIGYTMVYGIIGMINFAHGDIYMIGAYIGLVTLSAIGTQSGLPVWAIIGLMLVVSVFVTGVYGLVVEQVAYKPLRRSPRLVALISAIGMSIFLQNAVLLSQDSREKAIPQLISGFALGGDGSGVMISWMQIIVFVTTLVVMGGLTWFISRSRMGRACRACAEDLRMARLLGIDTDNVISMTFVIGGALAAVAAVLLGMQYGVINPSIGFLAGIKAFTAAVLGGIGSIPGAMLGGLLLGVAEAFGADIVGDQYKDVVAFSLLVLVLLFRPTGILGRPEVEKV